MKQLKSFNLCDNVITPQQIFRANLNHLPSANCRGTKRKLGAGRQPGEQSLLCGKCELRFAALQRSRFIKWIGKSDLAKIENQGGLR